jgi:hypothetical protein
MRTRLRLLAFVLGLLVAAAPVFAQAPTVVSLTTPFTIGSGFVPVIPVVPISATAAVNNATTLTIPTPPGGFSNYVCSLGYQLNSDATGAAVTNAVTTSTNFNAFAIKVSMPVSVNLDSSSGTQANGQANVTLFSLNPGGGCAKSTIPGTATTFVSTAGLTHAAWTWYATYYQAP